MIVLPRAGAARQLTFDAATTASDWREVHRLRDEAYRRMALTPSQWEQDRELDAMGWVGILRAGREPVATARGIPLTAPRCELMDLGHLPPWAVGDPKLCELGRLAARPRSHGLPFGILCLLEAGRWIRRNTYLERYIAYAGTGLLRYFTAWGAQDLGVRFVLPQRHDREYALITGRIGTRAALMARLACGRERVSSRPGATRASREAERPAVLAGSSAPF